MAIVIAFPICCMSQTIEIITEKPGELVDKLNDNKDFSELIIEGSISTFDMANLRRFLSKEDKSYSLDIRKSNIFDYDGNPVNGIPENFFAHFKNLTNVKLSNNIKFIGKRSFFETGITHIDIPSSVDSIFDGAFGQSQLSNINLNEGLKYIGSHCFGMCPIDSLYIPSTVDSIPGNFSPGAEVDLHGISISSDNKKYELVDYVIYSHDRTRIVSYMGSRTTFDIPETVKEIGDLAFCSAGLNEIIIPNNVTHIGKEAFGNCFHLRSVIIEGNIQKIENRTFSGCDLLTVRLNDNIKEIGEYAFSYCRNLKSIKIPKNIELIGHGAFHACENLNDIIIDKENKHYASDGMSVFSKDMKDLFIFYNKHVSSYKIPEGVENIRNEAFREVKNIRNIHTPKSLRRIYPYAFYYTNIESINLDGVTILDPYSLSFMSGIKEIALPDNINEMDEPIIYGMINMKKIKLPSSLKSIGMSNFDFIENRATEVFINSENPPVVKNNENSLFIDPILSTLYVPKKSIEKYKIAEYWSHFGNIKEIEGSDFPTSIKNTINKKEIQIYSNGNYLFINGIDNGFDIKIYDFKGIMRYQGKSDGQDIHINLPKGKYIIECGKERFKISL